jgi:flavin reductase (DIM6/NTAB) family NADH-FMN oxidoreductase RutF
MNEATLEHPLKTHASVSLKSRTEATVDRDAFVKAMRGAVTGVNVVTTDGPAGRFGVTVSAFSSVSADPAMLLVCINRRSPACSAIHANKKFCVNLLSTEQRNVADTFSGRPSTGAPYDFTAAAWNDEGSGSPALADTIASFDCALETAIQSGTHTIFIGRALAVRQGAGRPLLYTDRSYGRPCTDAELN